MAKSPANSKPTGVILLLARTVFLARRRSIATSYAPFVFINVDAYSGRTLVDLEFKIDRVVLPDVTEGYLAAECPALLKAIYENVSVPRDDLLCSIDKLSQ